MLNKRLYRWIFFITIVLLILSGFSVHDDYGWVDPITGSKKQQTVWLWFIHMSPEIRHSPVEERLSQMGIQRQPNCQFLYETQHRWTQTIFNDGSNPPMNGIPFEVLAGFTKASSDDDIRKFAHTLETGTEDEQRATVDAAGEKGIDSLANK
jgi:hypothetical protein